MARGFSVSLLVMILEIIQKHHFKQVPVGILSCQYPGCSYSKARQIDFDFKYCV